MITTVAFKTLRSQMVRDGDDIDPRDLQLLGRMMKDVMASSGLRESLSEAERRRLAETERKAGAARAASAARGTGLSPEVAAAIRAAIEGGTPEVSAATAPESRRIGISWAEAFHAVMYAAEGRGDIYYQSYARDMTRGFIDDCAGWATDLGLAASASVAGEVLIADEGDIQAFRIVMASGRQILAMTSSPRGFRSRARPGDVAVIDEAAFVDDLDAVLKAALAFGTWGAGGCELSRPTGARHRRSPRFAATSATAGNPVSCTA